MGMRHQSTFCNILLKYKTKPWNLGRKRKSSCQMLPNECSIMNPTYLRKKCPLLNRLFPKITSDWNSNNVSHPYQIFAFFFFFLKDSKLCWHFCSERGTLLLAAQIARLLLYMLISLLWTETLNTFTGEKQINDFLRELNNSA